jgi:pyridoxamine 5'-phosphate oxidase-like protein
VGKIYSTIDDTVRKFIDAQSVFFVGTAPLDPGGHVNVSPKGLDTLQVLGPSTIAYLDLTGSGIETVSHLKENGRIVLMFCAFQGAPKIVRLYGQGRVIEPEQAEFSGLAARFLEYEGVRAIILIEVSRISDSCGYGVPLLQYEGERSQLSTWTHKLGRDGLKTYRQEKNRESIDRLQGLEKTAE